MVKPCSIFSLKLRYRLKLGVQVKTLPTVGFNVEKLETGGGGEVWGLGLRDREGDEKAWGI